MRSVFAALLMLTISPIVWAQGNTSSTTGNMLLNACKAAIDPSNTTNREPYARGLCMGIVTGVADGDVIASMYGGQERQLCLPSNATKGQIARVVVQFMDQNPTFLHEELATLAWTALRLAWPCR